MKKYYDKSLDGQFEEIQTLNWVPWVGQEYRKYLGKRLLIVSESNYEWDDEEANIHLNDKNFTRDIINDRGLKHLSGSNHGDKIFRNIERAIFNSQYPSDKQKEKLWLNSAYYPFIQRQMKSIDQRPNDEDFATGWKTFFEMINTLNPNYCLFIGVSASNYMYSFNLAIQNSNYTSSEIKKHEKVGRAYPRTIEIIDVNKEIMKAVFIRHASAHFSWSNWANVIENKIPSYSDWIRENNISAENISNQ